MPSAFSNLLRFEKQATGENTSTWGERLNTNVFELVEDAIAGVATVPTTGGTTALTENNGVADQARCAVLRITGSLGSNATITVPDAVTKEYLVRNDTTGGFTVTIKTLSGTGVTVPQGMATRVRSDGTNVVMDQNVAAVGGVTPSAYILTLLDDVDAAAARTTLGLVAGGAGDIWVEKAGDTMTGALGIAVGADATPGLFVAGDPNTGLRGDAADSLFLITAGTKRIEVGATGNVAFDTNVLFVDAVNNKVGINNTTVPLAATAVLTLTNPATAASMQMTVADGGAGGGALVAGVAGGGLTLYTHTGLVGAETYTERARISADGTLLIGTTVDSSAATIGLLISGHVTPAMQLTSSSGGGGAIEGRTTAGLRFYTHTGAVGSESYTERMAILADGTVGIGTATDPSGTSVGLVVSTAASTSLQLTGTGSGGGGLILGVGGGGLTFYTHTGVVGSETYSERVRLLASGAVVLIAPVAEILKLEAAVPAAALYQYIHNTSGTAGSDALLILGVANGDNYIRFDAATGGYFSIGTDTSDSDKFKISAAVVLGTNDRVVLDSTAFNVTGVRLRNNGFNVVSILGQSGVQTTAPADTAENTLATISVPANSMGANGSIRIRALFSETGAGSKDHRIRFNGTQYAIHTVAGAASVHVSAIISNRNSTGSQVASPIAGMGVDGSSGTAITTSTHDTTTSLNVTITGQKATGADTLRLEQYIVELLPGA